MRHQNIVELKNNGMNNIESSTGEIVMYQPDETIRLEVRMDEETVWLSANYDQRNRPLTTSKLKSNMKGALMTMSDRLLTRKRAIIETVNDELKNIAQVEHSRHRSFDNFMVNLLGALAAYCFFPKKPCIACERVIDKQLALF